MRITVIRTTMKLRQISRVESSIFLGVKRRDQGSAGRAKGRLWWLAWMCPWAQPSGHRLFGKKKKICKGQMPEGGRFSRAFYVSLNKCCFSGQESVSPGVPRSKSHLWQLSTFFDFQQGRSQCHPKKQCTGWAVCGNQCCFLQAFSNK